MLVAALAFIIIVLLLIVLRGSSPTTGYDASYPQCSGPYPSNPLFGIVGVNGGLANNANPCISGELHWAGNAPGQKRPKQPPLSLYIDTGNPGGHQVADWPSGGTAPAYGSCNGLLTDACSYLYGEQRAAHSYRLVAALDSVAATTAPWWLDVELTASWAGTYQLNIADGKEGVDGSSPSEGLCFSAARAFFCWLRWRQRAAEVSTRRPPGGRRLCRVGCSCPGG